MIIHVAGNAAWWVRGAAGAALVLHVGGGCFGLVTGGISMFARKGGRVHRAAGRVFVAAMCVMGGMAVATAPFLSQRGNVVGGVFVLYLVLTGWKAMRPTRVVWAGMVGVAVAAGAFWVGWAGDVRADGVFDSQAGQPAFVLGAVALLAGVLDFSVMWRGGLVGGARVGRHLWRMCVAVFVASGSFFEGQQQVFPVAVQGSVFLLVPVLLPLGLMVFWLVRAGGGGLDRRLG